MPPSESTSVTSSRTSAETVRKLRPASGGHGRLLQILLLATLWIPPQVVLWGRIEDGAGGGRALGWTVYREPKLAVLQILGWVFLVAWVWRHREWLASWEGRKRVLDLLRHPFFLVFAVFLGYGALTLLWVRVPANLLYELAQVGFVFLFALTLALWASREPRVYRWLLTGLTFALVPAALLSALQLVGDLPFLRPIDPGYGVRHGSLFGAKNPLALALLGSFFLVLAWVARGRRGTALAALYAAGLMVLIASLHSRTALFALLAAGILLLLGLWLVPGCRGGRLVAVAGLAVALLAASLALSPGALARAESGLETLRHPGSYLESDRGIYLRNTLRMVREHPLGVGLGDWQTRYPLHRTAGPEAAFTASHQARRAHSDLVQVLGETGWPGLALWILLWAVALAVPLRDFVRRRRPVSLFLAAQVLALFLVGATDYLVEQPWHKLQLFGVAVLGVIAAGRTEPEEETVGLESAGTGANVRRFAWLAPLLLTLLAGGAVWYYTQHLIGSQLSAELAARYRLALRAEEEGAGAGERRRLWVAVEEVGARVGALAGHSRTSYRDPLIRAHAALALGDRPRAFDLCRQSLRLHPYYPNTYLLLAEIVTPVDRAEGARLRRTYHHLLEGAPPSPGIYSTEIEAHGVFQSESGTPSWERPAVLDPPQPLGGAVGTGPGRRGRLGGSVDSGRDRPSDRVPGPRRPLSRRREKRRAGDRQ